MEVTISRKQMGRLPCFILNNFHKDLLRDYKMINVSYTETLINIDALSTPMFNNERQILTQNPSLFLH